MSVQINSDAIKAMALDPNGPIAKAVEHKAIQTVAIAQALLKIPGSGRFYPAGEYFLRRGSKLYHWTRKTDHQASAAGEPPAGDTGYLAASVGHRLEFHETVVAVVEAKANYGIYLELGTRYMLPRPFLRPALTAAMRE